MTQDEFKNRMLDIYNEFKLKEDELRREYALANTDVKEGDIVSDATCTIKVDKILHTTGPSNFVPKFIDSYIPTCVFVGPELRKDFVPKKNGDRSNVHQTSSSFKLLKQ